MKSWIKLYPGCWAIGLVAVMTVALAACGAAEQATTAPAALAPTSTPVQEANPVPTVASGETPKANTPVPVAEPTSKPRPSGAAKPAGTINVGVSELGRFNGHPTIATGNTLTNMVSAPIGEGLSLWDVNYELKGWLLESWSISEDATTWTLKLRQGVQFHQGYGEMTAEDMIWSYQEGWSQNEKHARPSDFKAFWSHPEGSVESPDPYTIVVNTGVPLSAIGVHSDWMAPSGPASWIVSKRQTEELGIEEADGNIAATGPWAIVEHKSSQFWRMEAVENHWRQTPNFEELVFWEIPEESARVAGFQTGRLDTFVMAFDSISAVEGVPGASLMSVPGGAEYGLLIYGNYHVEALAGEPPPSYKPEMPWISGNADPDSDEWKRAVKVRQAMSIAIDRQALIDTLLHGYARPSVEWPFVHNERLLGDRRWDYDPDRARELLAEAGYEGGGFSITLTPAIRGAAAEKEVCEAVGAMWNTELGIDVRIQNIPYSTLRPQWGARTYEGASCHPFSARIVVGLIPTIITKAPISTGVTHPYLEERVRLVPKTANNEDREKLESEIGIFLFDNALTNIGLVVVDVLWPVGPRIKEWKQHVRTRDLRFITGFEYIEHR